MAMESIWRGGRIAAVQRPAQPRQQGPQPRLGTRPGGRGRARRPAAPAARARTSKAHQRHGAHHGPAPELLAPRLADEGQVIAVRGSGVAASAAHGQRRGVLGLDAAPASWRRSSNGWSSGRLAQRLRFLVGAGAESGASEQQALVDLGVHRRQRRHSDSGGGSALGGSGRRLGQAGAARARRPPRHRAAGAQLASKTSAQWPQRTQPSEILSWSGTTLNIVPQAGQRVIRLMSQRL